MMCNNRTAGERTARQRFLINGACCRSRSPSNDPIDEFQGCFKQINIQEGDGISITGDKTNVKVGLKPVHNEPKTYNNPEQVVVNKFGQVISVKEGAPPPEPFYIFPDYPDVVILSPTSLSSIGANTHLWSGRWRTTVPRMGAFKLSFTINTGKAFIGITTSATMRGKYFLKSFLAGFYFESSVSFGVIDEAQKDTGLLKIGKWSPTDVFSVSFNSQQFIYCQNGKKIHMVQKNTHLPLYISGAFHNKEKIIQVVTNLSIQEIPCAPDEAHSVQPIMKCAEGRNMPLYRTESIIVQAMIHTRAKGNISAWANIDASGPIHLTLVIKGLQKEKRITLLSENGNAVAVFLCTSEYYPSDTYTVTLYGRRIYDDTDSAYNDSTKESTCNGFTESDAEFGFSETVSCAEITDSEPLCKSQVTSCHNDVSVLSSRIMVMGHLL